MTLPNHDPGDPAGAEARKAASGGILERIPGYPFAVMTTMGLPPNLSAPGQAREAVRRVLSELGLPHTGDAEIVVSELVANAVRHGATPISLTLGATPEHLLIAVQDADPAGRPVPLAADADDTSGRGMMMVSAVSQRWGYAADDNCKVVWAELAIA